MKTATYARYSTDRQDARSIEDQRRRCRAYAAQRSWEIVAEYADAAVSGTHTERRELQQLIALGGHPKPASSGHLKSGQLM
jgi:DNA invertase Pin-like site-specific DNA recombinase